VDDKNKKKSTANLLHRQYMSLNTSNIGFGALAAVFGEYCGKNAPDTGVYCGNYHSIPQYSSFDAKNGVFL